MEKAPLKSVTVPVLVPFIRTFTPIRVSPSKSVTIPEITLVDFCEKAKDTLKNIHKISMPKILLLSFTIILNLRLNNSLFCPNIISSVLCIETLYNIRLSTLQIYVDLVLSYIDGMKL
ncbi:hypothetical protein SDC9_169629 [bioreactor metagenome]|uniref:Uncharacterized protein n=1 Tax=bioreactor metagenome TaxID=1076179 RepID=A0A645G7Y6_9ZZZZ